MANIQTHLIPAKHVDATIDKGLPQGSNVIGKITIDPISDTPEFFEDTSFVTGDSPATLDINAALGRNATSGYIVNDGAGNFTVSFSVDGAAFGDEITLKKNEVLNWDNQSVDTIRITWVSDSAYRVSAI